MRRLPVRASLCVVSLMAAGAAFFGCSDSSSRSGGGAASTAAPVASGATGGTAPGAGASPVAAPVQAVVSSLRVVGAPLVSGDVVVAFKLSDPGAAAAGVEVLLSLDGGLTWRPATPAAGSASLQGLATSAAPGLEHLFTWDSAADVPGFAADARVQVAVQGGASSAQAATAVDNEVPSAHVAFDRRPYLQSTDRDSTLVAWRTAAPTDRVIEFGDTPALGRTAGDPQASGDEHVVELSGLAPGTRCWYRVVANGRAITRRLSFETAPAAGAGAEVSFLVFGDSGMNNQVQKDLGALMAGEDCDLVLHTGDVIYPIGGLGAPVREYNERFFHIYEGFLHRAPVFPAIGNHDLYGLGGQPYKRAFHLPSAGASSLLDELYYAFEWGDCTFVAIESNFLFKSPVGPHVTWFLDTLRNATTKWVIVFMHEPLYSAGDHGDSPILQSVIGPIMEQNGVDVVFAGHDHNYERTKAVKQFNVDPAYRGIVHVITGGGGANTRAVSPTQNTDVALEKHHYTRVRIQGDTLTGEAVDATGQVIDSFTVQNP